MDSDLISFESMIATRSAADWAFGSMLAAIISAGATIATLFYAAKALNTWRKQEELKLKLDFKLSLIELAYAIDAMPNNWSFMHVNVARNILKMIKERPGLRAEEVKIFYLKEDMVAAHRRALKSWIMCSQFFKKSRFVGVWSEFEKKYHNYEMKGGNKSDVLPLLNSMVNDIEIF
ncbi:hypothetical protein ABNP39_08180 [Pantoea dispersa]|uniref:hypothetical protein n=1 Tax=Pantoea dispersa TaxID=59814 RepID=UPI0032EF1E08